MRPIQNKRLKQFETLILYKDDVEDMLILLSNHCSSVRVSTEAYEYDNAEEFWSKNKISRPNRLVLSGYNPSVYVTLQPWGARVEAQADDPLSIGLLDALCTIVNRYRNWHQPRRIFSAIAPSLVVCGMSSAAISFFVPWPPHMPRFDPIFHGVSTSFVVFGVLVMAMRFKKADVRLDVCRDVSGWIGWFERQWAPFIAPSIIAIAPSLIGWLASKYWPF